MPRFLAAALVLSLASAGRADDPDPVRQETLFLDRILNGKTADFLAACKEIRDKKIDGRRVAVAVGKRVRSERGPILSDVAVFEAIDAGAPGVGTTLYRLRASAPDDRGKAAKEIEEHPERFVGWEAWVGESLRKEAECGPGEGGEGGHVRPDERRVGPGPGVR